MANLNLANLLKTQGFNVSGTPGSYSGYSVSGAGDVNGDGYDDIIIGAVGIAPCGPIYCAGASYIVYGSISLVGINLASLTVTQGVIISGIASSWSGCSVSGAGDVNGDGYDDVVIGARYANNTSGAAYVIYGGEFLPSTIDLINLPLTQGFNITGTIGSGCGNSVRSAGDVNGDGYADVVIGAQGASSNSGMYVGESYIIYGGPTISLTNIQLPPNFSQGFSITGTVDAYYSGWSVSGAGDVNGDGYGDVVIGAPGDYYQAGESYVIYGGPTISLTNIQLPPNSLQGFSITGATSGDQIGYSVSGVGDVNRDGYDDIVIGAPFVNGGSGESYVVFGGPSLININLQCINNGCGFSISGAPTGSQSGYSVSGVGDVNRDGYDDIIIGAPDANIDNGEGESYVIYGSLSPAPVNLANLDTTLWFSISETTFISASGFSVSGAGDVNNDSYPDIIIGAYYSTGESYVIYGAASGFTTSLPTLFPTVAPTRPLQWWEASEFQKYAFSIGGSILTFLASWILREKIAFYILNNWGHKYVLYNPYVQLKENEIGLKLSTDNKLVCIVKFHEYPLLNVDHDNTGISNHLYSLIKQVLENPTTSRSFSLIQFEKNQIRDYLVTHKYLEPTRTYCFLKSYTELGYATGAVYELFLNNFELEHTMACKKQVRSISMDKPSTSSATDNSDTHSTSNPIITHELQWNIRKSERQSSIDDVENSVHDSNVLEINRQDTRSLNAKNHDSTVKKGCVLMSIDAMMDPEHVRLQNEVFLEFGNQLTYVAKETADSHTKLLTIENSISTSSNIDYSSAALFTQATLEYAPTIRYFFKVLGIDLPQVHLPNEFWAGVHFAAGMVKINANNDLILGQMLESASYYARLVISDDLSKTTSDEKPTDIISFAQTCGKHIAVGGTLGLVSNNPIYGAINGAAMCLNQHQILEESAGQTAVRYAVDVVVGVAAAYELADQNILTQAVGVIGAVSMSDIATKVGVATIELGMNGLNEMFEVGNYD